MPNWYQDEYTAGKPHVTKLTANCPMCGKAVRVFVNDKLRCYGVVQQGSSALKGGCACTYSSEGFLLHRKYIQGVLPCRGMREMRGVRQ